MSSLLGRIKSLKYNVTYQIRRVTWHSAERNGDVNTARDGMPEAEAGRWKARECEWKSCQMLSRHASAA